MSLISLQKIKASRLPNDSAQVDVIASQTKRPLTHSALSPVFKTQTFEFFQNQVPYVFEGYSPEIKISKLTLSNAKLLMFPKSEGVVIDCENHLIQETMIHLGVKKRNPYLCLDQDQYYLKDDLSYQHLDQCTICFDCASFNYYHLLLIYYALLIIANQCGQNQSLVVSNLSEYKKFYPTAVMPDVILELASRLPLQNGNQLLPLREGIYQVKQLDYIFVNATQHQYPKPRTSLIFHDLIQQGYADLKSSFSTPTLKPSRRIYISRQKCNNRTIANEHDILPLLEKHQFEIVFLEDLTLQQQIETFCEAKMIVATHGAGLSNLVFAHPEITLFELLIEGDERPFFFNICAAFGMKYMALTCSGQEGQAITVNPQQFEEILEGLVEADSN